MSAEIFDPADVPNRCLPALESSLGIIPNQLQIKVAMAASGIGMVAEYRE
jgi:hypothetical protein